MVVILSGAEASRSEVSAESKDPYRSNAANPKAPARPGTPLPTRYIRIKTLGEIFC